MSSQNYLSHAQFRSQLFRAHTPSPILGFRRRSTVHSCYRRLPGLSLLLLLLVFPAHAQDFIPEQVVFPITDFKPDIKRLSPLAIRFGTGFCLDADCRFIVTNYHAAELMGRYIRVKGVFSAHRYLDSGPSDTGAQYVDIPGAGSLKYTPSHDLAIYEMRRPLKHMHGIILETEALEDGRDVDIYGYPFKGNLKREMASWHGKLLGHTPEGLLAFSYEEGRVHAGASGSIVIDRKTKKLLGVFCAKPAGSERVILAVPVTELRDFVKRVHPYLQEALFPKTVFVSPVAPDLYSPYIWPAGKGLSQRPEEHLAVAKLRRTAQSLADSMRNFTAVQTFTWGQGNRPPDVTDAYETLIVDGWQRWRRPGSKKLHDRIPPPLTGGWVVPAAEWSELPTWVGTELNLRIHQAPDTVLGGRTVHVFQYAARAEDNVCRFEYFFSLSHFLGRQPKSYDCHGEAWTDESGNLLRISETFDLSGPSERYRGVVTYGQVEKDGKHYLVPLTIATQVEPQNYWCRGLFTDYEMFGVKSHILGTDEQEHTQDFGIAPR